MGQALNLPPDVPNTLHHFQVRQECGEILSTWLEGSMLTSQKSHQYPRDNSLDEWHPFSDSPPPLTHGGCSVYQLQNALRVNHKGSHKASPNPETSDIKKGSTARNCCQNIALRVAHYHHLGIYHQSFIVATPKSWNSPSPNFHTFWWDVIKSRKTGSFSTPGALKKTLMF